MNEEIKEKADELINRFMFAKIYFTDGEYGALRNAKYCAILECQSIIDELEFMKHRVVGKFQIHKRITFYKGVITAIEQQ